VQHPDRLKARLKELPAEPGCYLMRDGDDRILYIGKAKVLRQRVRSYFHNSPGHSPRISLMVRQVCDLEFIVTDSEDEALALESNLIKHHQPHFNVLLKDDKKYPYVCITWSESYPRIFITRQRRFRKPHDRFYGPYVDVGQLRRTLAMVKRVFPLRQRPQPQVVGPFQAQPQVLLRVQAVGDAQAHGQGQTGPTEGAHLQTQREHQGVARAVMPLATQAAATSGLVLGHQQGRAGVAGAGALHQLAVGRGNFSALLDQPLGRQQAQSLGESRVPRHMGAPQRQG
jgi:hypothetical protein